MEVKKVPKLAKSIIPILEEMIDGQVIFENEEFYVQKIDGRKVNSAVEAEGLKKNRVTLATFDDRKHNRKQHTFVGRA